MRAVIQRVERASVTIAGDVVGKIGAGYLILLGVGHADTRAEADKLWGKIFALRINDDEEGRRTSRFRCGRRGSGGLSVHAVRQLQEGPPPLLCRGRATGAGHRAL